ncbi:MAG: tyrosine-type recombinase/integrase [Micavibrio sp.]
MAALDSPAEGKRSYIYDQIEKGLILQITLNGHKSFYFYKRIEKKTTRIKIGDFPETSVSAARREIVALRQRLLPANPSSYISHSMTFRQMYRAFMEQYSMIEKKSWRYDEREIPMFCSHPFDRRISSIKRAEINNLHKAVALENGIYQANRILERIRAMYNKMIEWGWEGDNPATRIKKFREKARERFILPQEMPRFLQAVYEEENKTARDIILMALLTGARKSNILQMRWEQICMETATWYIPQTKNGFAHAIPLSKQAMEILEQRIKKKDENWVFPGRGAEGHYICIKKAWQRMLKASGLKNLRFHDLRRTLGSWQAAVGENMFVIAQTLGHQSIQSTAIYARLNLDPVRKSVEHVASEIFKRQNC